MGKGFGQNNLSPVLQCFRLIPMRFVEEKKKKRIKAKEDLFTLGSMVFFMGVYFPSFSLAHQYGEGTS